MSIQEYLFRKWQAVGLTPRENEVLTYLEELDPDTQKRIECEWYKQNPSNFLSH